MPERSTLTLGVASSCCPISTARCTQPGPSSGAWQRAPQHPGWAMPRFTALINPAAACTLPTCTSCPLASEPEPGGRARRVPPSDPLLRREHDALVPRKCVLVGPPGRSGYHSVVCLWPALQNASGPLGVTCLSFPASTSLWCSQTHILFTWATSLWLHAFLPPLLRSLRTPTRSRAPGALL